MSASGQKRILAKRRPHRTQRQRRELRNQTRLRVVNPAIPKAIAATSPVSLRYCMATVWRGRKMSNCLTILCILSLILSATANGYAASTLKITCSGNLTNTRADGDTLGQCDLNFLSVKEMTEIEDTCGIPGTVDTPAENQCRIRAVVSPDPISTADKRKLYKVLELWSVEKR
jgi:hypothetical protein